jgi:hypothetical protein
MKRGRAFHRPLYRFQEKALPPQPPQPQRENNKAQYTRSFSLHLLCACGGSVATHLKLIAVFILIFCRFTPSYAQTVIDDQREDTQFWNETQIIFPMRDRVDLMLFGVLRIGRDLARPVDERGGAGVAFKTNRFLTVIPTWLYIAQQPTATSKNIEHRPIC